MPLLLPDITDSTQCFKYDLLYNRVIERMYAELMKVCVDILRTRPFFIVFTNAIYYIFSHPYLQSSEINYAFQMAAFLANTHIDGFVVFSWKNLLNSELWLAINGIFVPSQAIAHKSKQLPSGFLWISTIIGREGLCLRKHLHKFFVQFMRFCIMSNSLFQFFLVRYTIQDMPQMHILLHIRFCPQCLVDKCMSGSHRIGFVFYVIPPIALDCFPKHFLEKRLLVNFFNRK